MPGLHTQRPTMAENGAVSFSPVACPLVKLTVCVAALILTFRTDGNS
jgi:hypothetical protein